MLHPYVVSLCCSTENHNVSRKPTNCQKSPRKKSPRLKPAATSQHRQPAPAGSRAGERKTYPKSPSPSSHSRLQPRLRTLMRIIDSNGLQTNPPPPLPHKKTPFRKPTQSQSPRSPPHLQAVSNPQVLMTPLNPDMWLIQPNCHPETQTHLEVSTIPG